jgi:hypothetical protein
LGLETAHSETKRASLTIQKISKIKIIFRVIPSKTRFPKIALRFCAPKRATPPVNIEALMSLVREPVGGLVEAAVVLQLPPPVFRGRAGEGEPQPNGGPRTPNQHSDPPLPPPVVTSPCLFLFLPTVNRQLPTLLSQTNPTHPTKKPRS